MAHARRRPLGLEASTGYSPAVQTGPPCWPASGPWQKPAPYSTPDRPPTAACPLDREAKHQGQRAQALRTQLDQQAAPEKRQLELALEPDPFITQLDTWNLRERGDWGPTARQRRAGHEPERWPWVCTGVRFRLDQRGCTAGGRPLITGRGLVAPRAGLEALREPRHTEALRRGLGQAAGARVIGDGAVGLWRLADDRWPRARQRLDFHPTAPHLPAVGRAFWGEDRAKLTACPEPLVRQLQCESPVKVIGQLEAVQMR